MAVFTTGAVLGGLGLGAKLYGQRRASNAIDSNVSSAVHQQRQMQDQLDQERQQLISEAMDNSAVGRQQVEDAQADSIAKAMESYEGNQAGGPERSGGGEEGTPAPASEGAASGPSGQSFGSVADRLTERRDADNTQRREATAELDSLASVFADNQRAIQPIQGEVNINRRTAQQEAQRLPLEVQAAVNKGSQKGRTARMFGDAGLTLGTALMAGGQGGPAAGLFGAQGGQQTSQWAMNHPTAGVG